MDPDEAQETSERDQLWASLRALRPEIDQLAAGKLEATERQARLILIIARVVAAEMDFRSREAEAETEPPA
jgi:hypothetical protein